MRIRYDVLPLHSDHHHLRADSADDHGQSAGNYFPLDAVFHPLLSAARSESQEVMNTAAIFGKGISFPPRVGPDGHVAWSWGEQNVREAIRVILMTNLKERIRLPE